MATKGLLNKIATMADEKAAVDGTFTFADSDAQYTVYKVEMPLTLNANAKRSSHVVTIENPSTETALKAIKKEILLSGIPANDCIKYAVERNWVGFESSWVDKTKIAPKKSWIRNELTM